MHSVDDISSICCSGIGSDIRGNSRCSAVIYSSENGKTQCVQHITNLDAFDFPACALRALGLLLADGAPTVQCSRVGEVVLPRRMGPLPKTAVTWKQKVKKSIRRLTMFRPRPGKVVQRKVFFPQMINSH